MELYDKYIYLGGGGGYEIANKIQVYTVPIGGGKLGLLTNLVHEESTDKQVANYMMAARDVISSHFSFMFCLGIGTTCRVYD